MVVRFVLALVFLVVHFVSLGLFYAWAISVSAVKGSRYGRFPVWFKWERKNMRNRRIFILPEKVALLIFCL